MFNIKKMAAVVLLVAAQFMGAMDQDDTKFYLQLGDERVKITRAGLELSKIFKDEVEEQEKDAGDDKKEFFILLDEFFKGVWSKKGITFAHIKAFAKLSDDVGKLSGDDADQIKKQIKKIMDKIKDKDFVQLILLADFLIATPMEEHDPRRDLLALLLEEFGTRIKDEHYLQFLDGEGILGEAFSLFHQPLFEEFFQQFRVKPIEFSDVSYFYFSPDGKVVGVSFKDYRGILFDIESKQEIQSFSGVSFFRFSPDGKAVGVSFRNEKGILFDIENKKKIQSFSGVSSFSFSPDGKVVGVQFNDDKRILFDIESKQEIKSFDNAYSFKFSPDGKMVGVQFKDGRGILFDIKSKQEIQSFPGVSFYSFSFSPDGKVVGVKFRNDRGILFDIKSKKKIKSFSGVSFFPFSPDGKVVGVSFRNEKGILFDIENKKKIKSFSGVSFFSFSPDGKVVAVQFSNNRVILFDIESKQEIDSFYGVSFFRFSPDGKMVGVEFIKDGKGILFDIESKQEIHSFLDMDDFSFSPDGKMVWVRFKDDKRVLFDLLTWKKLNSFNDTKGFQFSPDGETVGLLFKDGRLEIAKIISFLFSPKQQVLVRALQLLKKTGRNAADATKKIKGKRVLLEVYDSFDEKQLEFLTKRGLVDRIFKDQIKKLKEIFERRKKVKRQRREREKQKRMYEKHKIKREQREKELQGLFEGLDQEAKKHIKAFLLLLKDVKSEADLKLPGLLLRKIKKQLASQKISEKDKKKIIKQLEYEHKRAESKFDVEEEGEVELD